MPTHALGTGTVNLTLNVPKEEKDFWGRVAFQFVQQGQATSTGDYLRTLIFDALKVRQPDAAKQLAKIRQRHHSNRLRRIRCYGAALTLLICSATVASWFGAGDLDAMRSLRSGRRGSIVRRVEWEEA